MGNEEVMAENVGDTFISGQGVSLLMLFSIGQLNSPLFPLICEDPLCGHCSSHLQNSYIEIKG